ncbi:MAG: putative sulfate exporter family transporter [Acidobacteriota bacterium]
MTEPGEQTLPAPSAPSSGKGGGRAGRLAFLVLLLFSASPWGSPPLALLLGIGFGLTFPHPWLSESQRFSRLLLQASVVGLGFGMNLYEVIKAGSSGFLYTAVGISFALLLGTLLGRILSIDPVSAFLISVGTAICGGSAIAAVAPITEASDEQISVSLATVFLLNSVALLTFPPIGVALGMTQQQFGLWAALAIHDTSSVVGAAAKFGAVALAVGTTVKLARALWIVPLALITAAVRRSKAKIRLPWFILFFVIAACVNSWLPAGRGIYSFLYGAARIGLTVTLFLIGSNISRQALRKVGPRPLMMALALWAVVGVTTLLLIRAGIVH